MLRGKGGGREGTGQGGDGTGPRKLDERDWTGWDGTGWDDVPTRIPSTPDKRTRGAALYSCRPRLIDNLNMHFVP